MSDEKRHYPRGRLNESDEGETPMGVGVELDIVMLRFKTPILWVGMPAEQAEQLADLLREKAAIARRNRQ